MEHFEKFRSISPSYYKINDESFRLASLNIGFGVLRPHTSMLHLSMRAHKAPSPLKGSINMPGLHHVNVVLGGKVEPHADPPSGVTGAGVAQPRSYRHICVYKCLC